MYKVYQTKIGDTLDSIAKMFNMSLKELETLNDLTNFKIGMPLVVYNDKNNWYKVYNVLQGDTLYSIASNNNINLNDLIAINGLDKDSYIYPNQKIIIPKEGYQIYITKKEDNMLDVLKYFNIYAEKLMEQNNNIMLMEDQLLINKM